MHFRCFVAAIAAATLANSLDDGFGLDNGMAMCEKDAVVGTCADGACLIETSNAHCAGMEDMLCVCDPGHCSSDAWNCVPIPAHEKAATSAVTTTQAEKAATGTVTTTQAPCIDADKCLDDAWVGSGFQCAMYAAYCDDANYGSTLRSCCAKSCNACAKAAASAVSTTRALITAISTTTDEAGSRNADGVLCRTGATVGMCDGNSCFFGTPNAHCADDDGANRGMCVCDVGHCSYDNWNCVPIPTTSKSERNDSRRHIHSSTSNALPKTTTSITTTKETYTTTATSSTTMTTTDTTTFTSSKLSTKTATRARYYENAVVGSCLGIGCFWQHGNAHCGGWARTQCICDEGYCTNDMWHCVPCPNSTVSRTVSEPIPGAVVGGCAVLGCFLSHGGNSRCGGWKNTQCVCDKGYCSSDQWHCEPCAHDDGGFVQLAETPATRNAETFVLSSLGFSCIGIAAAVVSFVLVLRRLSATQQLAEPLLPSA